MEQGSLHWIGKCNRKFLYVKNRSLHEHQEHTSTKESCTHILARGSTVLKLMTTLWLKDQNWLENEENWPDVSAQTCSSYSDNLSPYDRFLDV